MLTWFTFIREKSFENKERKNSPVVFVISLKNSDLVEGKGINLLDVSVDEPSSVSLTCVLIKLEEKKRWFQLED